MVRRGVVALLIVPALASAAPTLTHSGRLTDAQGHAIEGAHTVEVALWTAGTGGTLLHQEAFPLSLQGGFYSVVLGANSGNLIGATELDGDVWVEVTVDPPAAPLVGRQRVTDVAHATRAATSADAQALTPVVDARFSGFQQFSGSTTWTVPSNVTRVYAEVMGGGGGGGGGNYNASTQARGGAQGGWGERRAGFITVTPGSTLTINIGLGGNPGASNGGTGGNGGATSVTGGTPTITANGGMGSNLDSGGYPAQGTGGVRLESRLGLLGHTIGSSTMTGYSVSSGAGCSYSPGEGGCGGRAIQGSGDAGNGGQSGVVRLMW
jgi:hypothetical protein